MAHRINLMIDDELWQELESVPEKERYKLINQAVSESLLRRQREAALSRMRARAAEKEKLPGTAEEWVREDRDNHP